MEENEVELMDYLNVIWKRKWLIILPTLLCVIVAGIYSFLLPSVWEVDTIIAPSKFFVKTEGWQFEEVIVVDPKQIAGQINQASYNTLIAAELNLDIRGFPKLKAENLKDTKIVRISIRERDVEKAKLILYSLFTHLKSDLDGKADIEKERIVTQIKSKEIEKKRIEEEIRTSKNRLNVIRQREKELDKEMNDIRKRIDSLQKEQRFNLKKAKKSENESLAILLYSNEILQNHIYFNTINDWLIRKKIEEENINLEMENKEEKIKQIENEIDNLKERKGRIGFTHLIKKPTSSLSPISPKKKTIVLLGGILGLMIFTLLAFFIEYVEKQKTKGKS